MHHQHPLGELAVPHKDPGLPGSQPSADCVGIPPADVHFERRETLAIGRIKQPGRRGGGNRPGHLGQSAELVPPLALVVASIKQVEGGEHSGDLFFRHLGKPAQSMPGRTSRPPWRRPIDRGRPEDRMIIHVEQLQGRRENELAPAAQQPRRLRPA